MNLAVVQSGSDSEASCFSRSISTLLVINYWMLIELDRASAVVGKVGARKGGAWS